MNDEPSTYLGLKGYSLYKDALTIKEQQYIRNELTVRPYVPKSPVQPTAFPVYRESTQKLYVPRYFGEEQYGIADEMRITHGDNINIPFVGNLRDYQEKATTAYLNKFQKKEMGGGGLLDIPCGKGKTVIALNIISLLAKKTIVIVHKSFLMNQWIERIGQFLPTARVGRIQGQTIDIENKDIVIGMLQSLSMKEYPQNMFESFGLTIVDEVHHISSEVFSRSLFNIVTKFTLGLSATMRRKDGLTKVFKMFLGDIVYKIESEKKEHVLVKSIDYITTDPEFLKVEIDYRGNTKYSTMLSKLCTFNHRSEFILKVIQDELERNPNKQLMVLGHYKNMLVYLFKAIEHRKFASVGYYLGGMKEVALKETETKQIIIATYAMAAEALDIKTLSSLILATPKTDVIQAVGRILRTTHSQPLVIDIVDQHDIFKRQWKKRRAYFMKQHYKIIHSNNIIYDKGEWSTIFDPNDITCKSRKKNKKTISQPETEGTCLVKL